MMLAVGAHAHILVYLGLVFGIGAEDMHCSVQHNVDLVPLVSHVEHILIGVVDLVLHKVAQLHLGAPRDM